MLVSRSARVCFVHVQKTGGLTVEARLAEALSDLEPLDGLGRGRHARLDQALAVHPEIVDYWTFGFVRNPWARLWSWWSMVQRRLAGAEAGNAFVAKRLSTNRFWRRVGEYDDFERFVLDGVPAIPRLHTPQLAYLTAPGRRADFIGRTERLDDDLDEVFHRLGLAVPARSRTHNAAPPGPTYRDQFTPAMVDTVARAFKVDLDEFGYTF